MTIEEYSTEVQELLKNANGYVNGIKLAKDINVRMNVANINGNPALILSETTEEFKPTKINYCIEMADIQTVRAMQVWLNEIQNQLLHDSLLKSDVTDIAGVSNNTESTN